MSLSNQSARQLMSILEAMRAVQGVDLSLEKSSISHKIKSLLNKPRTTNMTPQELVADMSDDELAYAIITKDERLGNLPKRPIDPCFYRQIQDFRPRVWELVDRMSRAGLGKS
jgi:hypothetical protein